MDEVSAVGLFFAEHAAVASVVAGPAAIQTITLTDKIQRVERPRRLAEALISVITPLTITRRRVSAVPLAVQSVQFQWPDPGPQARSRNVNPRLSAQVSEPVTAYPENGLLKEPQHDDDESH